MLSAISSQWIALVAAVGIGSIVAAVVGWWSAKAVTIANHRQNWINALRDDLVTYLKEVDTMHYRMARLWGDSGEAATTADVEKQQETRNAVMLAYRRILLRLNMTEAPHVKLAEKLNDLRVVKGHTADSDSIDAVVKLSREVLKHEWAVTKYGIFTKPVLAMKASLKGMDGSLAP